MRKIQCRDGKSDAVPLTPLGITIGRAHANNIVIDEPEVNGFHADLKVEANRVTISHVITASGTALMEMGTVGWALACDISILEPSLSRKHAELYIENGDLIVSEPDSVKGTYVNAP